MSAAEGEPSENARGGEVAIHAKTSRKMGFPELVAITAAIMALNAFAIDMMLPALGVIGDALGAAQDNDRQLVIGVYVIANGIAQLFFGPLVDRYGRRRILLWALGGYLIGSLFSIFAPSFIMLLAARAFQGVATAGARVASMAIVRDKCAGRTMAKVMSFALTIFMAAPIIAPALGQFILFAAPDASAGLGAPWRWIFGGLFVYGLIVTLWITFRVPETLKPEAATRLALAPAFNAYRSFMTDRKSLGYTIASALCFGALFGYISASEQIFLEIYDLGSGFAAAFAVVAGALGVATLTNARLVERVGMRRLCHGALIAFVLSNTLHGFLAVGGVESLPVFLILMSAAFFCLGLIGPNCSALAMEDMGHIAGAAAAANGFAGTALAGLLGMLIGRAYDGTTTPIVVGFTLLGAAALALVFWVERGALFRTGEAIAGTEQPAPKS